MNVWEAEWLSGMYWNIVECFWGDEWFSGCTGTLLNVFGGMNVFLVVLEHCWLFGRLNGLKFRRVMFVW